MVTSGLENLIQRTVVLQYQISSQFPSTTMQNPERFQLLVWLLNAGLALTGSLLIQEFGKPHISQRYKGFIVGLGALTGGIASINNSKYHPDLELNALSMLIVGYVFCGFVMIVLLISWRQQKRAASDPDAHNLRREWRQQLLRAFHGEVTQRLADTLEGGVRLNPMQRDEKGEGIQPDWRVEVFGGTSLEMTGDRRMIDVFYQEEINGRLLIVGETGSGKTTLMLQLAEDLIREAQQDRQQPLPIWFELSTWNFEIQLMGDWMATQLKERYNVPIALTQEWIETGKLLPLLDGLDQVEVNEQGQCMTKINQFLQEHEPHIPVVLCYHQPEFAPLQRILNQFRGAIALQPLSDTQIQQYLNRLNYSHCWQEIQADPAGLLSLARFPLFLPLIPLACSPIGGGLNLNSSISSRGQKPPDPKQRYTDLFNLYITQCLAQNEPHPKYPPKSTQRWLSELALWLDNQKQPEFLLEQMQPTGLKKFSQYFSYKLIEGLIIVLIFVLILGIALWGSSGLIAGAILGLTLAVINGVISRNILTFENLTFSWINLKKSVIYAVILGIIMAVFFTTMFDSASVNEIIKFSLALTGFIAIGFGMISDEIRIKNKPNQGIIKSGKNSLIMTFIGLLFFLLPVVEIIRMDIGFLRWYETLRLTLSLTITLGFAFGGLPVIQHYTLRFILWYNGYLPFRYVDFLNHAVERRLLKRLGGRYYFFHDLLREHFAQMPLSR